MNNQTPPAGYYPDNAGVMRYWDGTQWTEHTQPQPQAAPTGPNPTGADRPWFKKKRYMIPTAVFALMIVGGALGDTSDDAVVAADDEVAAAAESASDESDTSKKAEKKEKAKPKKKAPVVKVNAGDMVREFEENELAGDKKYKGKRVQVSGVVDKIDTEFFDNDKYVLRISDGDEWAFLTVNCNDMSSDELSTLTVGEDVTAVRTFDDGGDLGVELKKCKLA